MNTKFSKKSLNNMEKEKQNLEIRLKDTSGSDQIKKNC